MFHHAKHDVLIVGAGPVGLFAAHCLRRRGLDVSIVDEAWHHTTRSYALALHPRSIELLEEEGLASRVLEGARRLDHVSIFHDAERVGEIDLSRLATRHPFVAVMPQSELESALESALSERGTNVEWNHRTSALSTAPDHVLATVDELDKVSGGYAVAGAETMVTRSRKVEARLVLGTDGHDSSVRRQLGIGFEALRPTEQFTVFEFEASGKLPQEMVVVLHEDTSDVFCPMPEGRYRFSFGVKLRPDGDTREKDRLPIDVEERSPELEARALRELISTRAPWFQSDIGEIRWSALVAFESRVATAFGKDRVWLAGDAAHLTGPIGAQSMNLGLLEASELSTLFADVIGGKRRPEALSAHGEERRRRFLTLLGVDGSGLRSLVPTTSWLASHGDRLAPCIPASGVHFRDVVAQLGLDWAGPSAA